jgi:hypothetical protein
LWPNSSIFVSSNQRTFLQKVAEQPFRLCRYRARFTVDIDTKVSSQGPLLLFWDWVALFTPKYVHL